MVKKKTTRSQINDMFLFQSGVKVVGEVNRVDGKVK